MLLKKHFSGVTLIELLIAVALVGVLLTLGLPSYAEYMRNSRIRTAAESTSSGLKLARTEAIRLNKLVTFTLTGSGSGWSVTDPDGTTLKEWDRAEGAKDVTLTGLDSAAASATAVTFSPMGRISSGTLQRIDINASSGTGQNLRIVINSGGSIFMCDPNITDAYRKC